MTAEIEPSQYLSPESHFNELINTFDAKDLDVRMNYSRYLERPNPRRMNSITESSSQLYGAFGDVLMFIQDTPDAFDVDSQPVVLASLLVRTATSHAELLGEYTGDTPDFSSSEYTNAYEFILGSLTENGRDVDRVIVNAVDGIRKILGLDIDIIELFDMERLQSPREVYKQRAIEGSIKLAIGGSVMAAMYIYGKTRRA